MWISAYELWFTRSGIHFCAQLGHPLACTTIVVVRDCRFLALFVALCPSPSVSAEWSKRRERLARGQFPFQSRPCQRPGGANLTQYAIKAASLAGFPLPQLTPISLSRLATQGARALKAWPSLRWRHLVRPYYSHNAIKLSLQTLLPLERMLSGPASVRSPCLCCLGAL